VQFASEVSVVDSTIEENFAVIGGVAYVNNDGFVTMSDNTIIRRNGAINTCFLFLINTQDFSTLSNVQISQNDQRNNYINKHEFLGLKEGMENYPAHMEQKYIDHMIGMGEDVTMVIAENADSAVYAIKAKLRFDQGTAITDNDKLLSASTESTIEMMDISITDLSASGLLIQTVSSTILLEDIFISRIKEVDGSTGFYKIQIMNDSKFTAKRTVLSHIEGALFYVGSSTVNFEDDVVLEDMVNKDAERAMITISTSTYNVINSKFRRLRSNQKILHQQLTSSDVVFQNVEIDTFDKTFLHLEEGSLLIEDTTIMNGVMSKYFPESDEIEPDYIYSNSMGFIILQCDAVFRRVTIENLQTHYSAAVIFIENDATSTVERTLTITDSAFENNKARLSSGVIESKNTNTYVD
jgi:hypothetical protein